MDNQEMFGAEKAIIQDSKIKRLFYQFFGELHIPTRIRAYHVLKKAVTLMTQDCCILDAGGGVGSFSFYLARKFPHCKIACVEIDPQRIIMAKRIARKRQVTNIDFTQQDLVKLKCDRPYDLVLCSDVLEHIDEDELVVRNFYRVLKDKGKLVLHVPGFPEKPFPWKREGLIYRPFVRSVPKWYREHMEKKQIFNLDAREAYSKEGILEKVQKAGFDIMEVSYTFGAFGGMAMRIFYLLRPYHHCLYVVFLPLLLALGFIDVRFNFKRGDSILIVATKTNEKGNAQEQ